MVPSVLQTKLFIPASRTNLVVRSRLDHLPPQIMIILSTRHDPPLPINPIQASGQLVELRASDLRFDLDEARILVQSIAHIKVKLSH